MEAPFRLYLMKKLQYMVEGCEISFTVQSLRANGSFYAPNILLKFNEKVL